MFSDSLNRLFRVVKQQLRFTAKHKSCTKTADGNVNKGNTYETNEFWLFSNIKVLNLVGDVIFFG